MNRKYQVQAVEPRARISHDDFMRPRNTVTLLRVEDGESVKVLLPTRGNWRRGDLIELEDFVVLRGRE
jgi:hypothetical protein